MIQSEFDNALLSLTGGEIERKRFLLAVSGGMDSMCMANLFLLSPLHPVFGVAHVNFSLRGEDSDMDHELVKDWAASHQTEFFDTKSDTISYAKDNSLSIEMAAREIRYGWFNKLMEGHGYDYLSVAHNLNDTVETLFINLLRGTGLRGLSGIRSINGKIIRPLLSISRERISEFVALHQIPYRDDATNFESYYTRNRVRNIIFPEFRKINPSFLNTVGRSMNLFDEAYNLLEELYLEKKDKLYFVDGEECIISIPILLSEKRRKYWLYRILSDKGFNGAQISRIEGCLSGQTGKMFRSSTHELVIDRGEIKVYPISGEEEVVMDITEPGIYNFRGVSFKFDIFIRPPRFSPIPREGQLFFDAEKVRLPFVCRSWVAGDKFRPFGMSKGVKKISDFFTDLKMDKRAKVRQPIICDSEGNIICLPGLRIDDRYKITRATKIIADIAIN